MKLFSLILSLACIIFALCSCQWNDEHDDSLFSYDDITPSLTQDGGTYYYGFTYTVYADSHIIITGYDGADPILNVPAAINGIPVTGIADEAFTDNTYITSAIIPESILHIGEKAFSGCTALVSVTVNGSSLSTIGDQVFFGTPYLSGNNEEFLIIGNGILIDYGGAAADVTVPEGVTVIAGAFENNVSLASVHLPQSLVSINGYSFNGCLNLADIQLPPSLQSIGTWAFAKCASLESIVIPDSVTSIGAKSFLLCESVRSVSLSVNLTGIPNSAFQSCKALTEITIPEKVSVIDENAFIRCASLEKATVPSSVISIGNGAFLECSSELTVHTPEGSYASQYFAAQSIPCSPIS